MVERELARSITATVRQFVASQIASLTARMDSFEQRLRDIPKPERGETGPSGKDAPAVDIDAIVERVTARIPAPREGAPGRDGKDAEVNRDALTLMVRDEVARAIAAIPPAKDGASGKDADLMLVREIAALEAEKAVRAIPKQATTEIPSPTLPPVIDHSRLFAEAVDRLVPAFNEKIRELVAAIPAPANGKDGESIRGADGAIGPPGQAGKDADMDAVGRMVRDAVAALPAPKDGARGEKGERGADGAPGRDGESVKGERGEKGDKGERGESIVGPEGKQGQRGEVGPSGAAGPIGPEGKRGERGEPGPAPTREVIASEVDRSVSGQLLEIERRGSDTIQRAIEKLRQPIDGKDGAPGRDAMELEDLTMEQDEKTGTITLVFKRGSLEKRFPYRPGVWDAGVFEEGRAYLKGDGVSFQGSFWIAQKDAPEGKPGAGDGWRLAVKSGRNGRDGQSIKGDPGPPGPPGQDLRYK